MQTLSKNKTGGIIRLDPCIRPRKMGKTFGVDKSAKGWRVYAVEADEVTVRVIEDGIATEQQAELFVRDILREMREAEEAKELDR